MQEELEAIVQLENYDLITIAEMWDDSLNWNTTIEVCKLFRRDRQGKSSGWVVLYVSEVALLRNNHNQAESLWFETMEQTNKGHLVVTIYYRTPGQGESANSLVSATRNIALTRSQPDGSYQPHGWLLGRQHSELKTIQEALGVSWGYLSSPNRPTRDETSLDLVLTSAEESIKEAWAVATMFWLSLWSQEIRT